MVTVWLEISGWFPALEPVILNVCTLGLKSVILTWVLMFLQRKDRR